MAPMKGHLFWLLLTISVTLSAAADIERGDGKSMQRVLMDDKGRRIRKQWSGPDEAAGEGLEEEIVEAFQAGLEQAGKSMDNTRQQEIVDFMATGTISEEGREAILAVVGQKRVDDFGKKRGMPTWMNNWETHEPSKDDPEGGDKTRPAEDTRHKRNKRSALEPTMTWQDGIVPYTFDTVYAETADVQQLIEDHLRFMERQTCVRFVPYYSGIHAALGLNHNTTLNFVDFSGCWSSSIGLTSGSGEGEHFQHVSTCGGVHTQHEVSHALGIQHTQRRSDSDTMYQVNINSIDPDDLNWFKTKDTDNTLPFSFESIMHYKAKFLSTNGEDTWNVYDDDLRYLNYADPDGYLHLLDSQAINYLYKCHERCPNFPHTCQNRGYVGYVEDECRCVCPRGLMGDTCEQKFTPTTQWPNGDFSLPMSVEGCPGDDFDHGTRDQSFIFSSYLRKYNDLFLPVGSIWSTKYFTHHFCTPTTPFTGGEDWPRGTYCIHRHGGSCPSGFTEGYMAHDDADTGNLNSVSGVVPDGEYGDDTTFYYCCRRDGSIYEPIPLPADQPFQLLLGEVGNDCQQVQGMVSRKGVYAMASELTPNNFSSPYPYFSPSWEANYNLLRHTYCYYEPRIHDCGQIHELTSANPSIVITSPITPLDIGSLCNWIIKSPNNTLMRIEFSSFNLPVGSVGTCDEDYLEIRQHRLSSPGEQYCGESVPRPRISYDNIIMLELMTSLLANVTRQFSATVTLVNADEYSYDVTRQGKTYGGQVSYTQRYQDCLGWDEVPQCTFNIFNSPDTLGPHNYCRNPANALRTWCYVDDLCNTDVCDPSGILSCYDKSTTCAADILTDPTYCTSDPEAFELCHLSCAYCGTDQQAASASCTEPPIITGTIITSTAKSVYYEGDTVVYECTGMEQTQTRTCLSDGTWSGYDTMCIGCPDGYVEGLPDVCYKASEEAIRYDAALASCQSQGGTLAMARTAEEQQAIELALPTDHTSKHFIMGARRTSPRVYEWADGTPLNYTNWAPSNLIKGSKNIAQRWIFPEGKYMWKDMNNYVYDAEYICQIDISGGMCADQRSDCASLLLRTPDLCTTQVLFARKMCRETCAFCTNYQAQEGYII